MYVCRCVCIYVYIVMGLSAHSDGWDLSKLIKGFLCQVPKKLSELREVLIGASSVARLYLNSHQHLGVQQHCPPPPVKARPPNLTGGDIRDTDFFPPAYAGGNAS